LKFMIKVEGITEAPTQGCACGGTHPHE